MNKLETVDKEKKNQISGSNSRGEKCQTTGVYELMIKLNTGRHGVEVLEMGPWQRNAWCVVRGMLDLLCKSKTGGNLGDERKRRRQQAGRSKGVEEQLRGSLPPEFPERSRPEGPKGQYEHGRTSARHTERVQGTSDCERQPSADPTSTSPPYPLSLSLSHPLNPLAHPHQGGIHTGQYTHFVQYCSRPGPCSGWTGVGWVGNGQWCLARGCACFCSAWERTRTRGTLAPKEA
ncbi:hypothetical protein BDP81DRAFT_198195 [Colletotrichum phormii]|uniref:Uncharacterized protein n=1 Tax=Colletotrichum phormii TaxID=359342 RepID=A0AAI9ZZ36_9PEZI|nr:uncharacterized protein BDP81DRAFT_198195 [Colletotrichum phormii]KAK1639182.1 hypothetical protein BDP81DRAFT_198195 [Colletotrichum phormii]